MHTKKQLSKERTNGEWALQWKGMLERKLASLLPTPNRREGLNLYPRRVMANAGNKESHLTIACESAVKKNLKLHSPYENQIIQRIVVITH